MKLVAGLVVFLAFGWVVIYSPLTAGWPGMANAKTLAARLQKSAQKGIEAANAGRWAHVRINGQTAVLSGRAPDETAAQKTVAAVLHSAGRGGAFFGGIVDVDRRGIDVLVPVAPFVWSARKATDGTVTQSGYMDSDAAIKSLDQSAQKIFGKPLRGSVQIAAGVPDDQWAAQAQTLLQALAFLDEGTVQLRDHMAHIEGTVTRAEGRDALNTLAQNMRAPYKLTTQIVFDDPKAKAAACQQDLQAILAKTHIRFSSGKAVISPASAPVLDALAARAKACPGHDLNIIGHTDRLGDPGFNLWLSKARAKAIGAALVARGVAAARIHSDGVGSDRPLCTSRTRTCRAQNRRIEITVEG